MSIVDVETGQGMALVQIRTANGRKFWAWGNDKSDATRMNFLSSCNPDCHMAYLEMQVGITPTQEQTIPSVRSPSVQAGEVVRVDQFWIDEPVTLRTP